MFRTGKRNTVELSEDMRAAGVGSYDPTDSIDDFLDAGGSFNAPVRAFPEQWTCEAVTHTHWFYRNKQYMTELRAAEMGVSRTYERHQYAPSWNAPYFPERQILSACGRLKRNEAQTKQAESKAEKERSRRRSGPGVGGPKQDAGRPPA